MDQKQVTELLRSYQNEPNRESNPDHFLHPPESGEKQPNVEQYHPQVEQEPTGARIEQTEKSTDNAISKLKGLLGSSKKANQKQIIPKVRDEVVLEVENILEDGLSDAFAELSGVEQQQFKLKGEETAFAIRDMMRRHKLKVRTIFNLILEWLKLLPGVNKFFLQQEAKIKVDKIVALHKRSNNKHM